MSAHPAFAKELQDHYSTAISAETWIKSPKFPLSALLLSVSGRRRAISPESLAPQNTSGQSRNGSARFFAPGGTAYFSIVELLNTEGL